MEKSTFVYVTYIRTTPEILWAKLTETGVAREFFFATALEAEWQVGGAWKSTAPDGTLGRWWGSAGDRSSQAAGLEMAQ